MFLVHLLSRTPHIHRDLEIGVILEGAVSVKLGDLSWTLEKNDIYLINSMEVHEFSAEGDGTLVLAIQIFSGDLQGGHFYDLCTGDHPFQAQ